MATSPNFNWPEPDNTDLVKNGALAIRTAVNAIDTSMVDLKGGTTGQILSKATNTDMDFAWITNDVGDITAVTAGTGLTGGGTSGAVSLAIDSTVTTLTGTQTLTNKTLTNPVMTTPTLGVASATTINNAVVNVSGTQNTRYGVTVLPTAATGTNNTAIGNIVLNNLTTGSYNTSVGTDSLNGLTTGSNNTACGSFNLGLVTTGSDNTALGVGAGSLMTSGGSNTVLGRSSGITLTTGSNNTTLGYQADVSSATVSNTITLGNSGITTLRCQVTSITALSDERDKKDIEPLEYGLDFVKELKPVSYTWNTRPETFTELDGTQTTRRAKVGIADIGFIAQDIVALEDSLDAADSLQLSFRDNPDKLEVTQGRLIPILVKAIQDLTAKVEALEAAQAYLNPVEHLTEIPTPDEA